MSRIQKFFSQRSSSLSTFPIAHVLLTFLTSLAFIEIGFDFDKILETELLRLTFFGIFSLPLTLIPGIFHLIKNKSEQTSKNVINDTKTKLERESTNVSKKRLSISHSLIVQILALGVGIGYYLLLGDVSHTSPYSIRIWVIGSIILSFLLIFLSVARTKKSNEAFTWTRRKGIIESVLIGGIAGLIIRGGISACIKSIEFLFNVEFSSGDIYGYVGAVSMIFLTGSIALLNFTNQENEIPVYTRIYRIFGQYIFLPLTIIYGLILISYGIKIIVTGIRPTGTIIYMVIGYIAFGLLTWLTTYPALPNSFISKSHFILFISFLLTSLLMIPAIQMRIDQYGLTIDRYFVCAIIAWIILFSIGGALFRRHRMIIIVSLLVLLGGVSLYGGKWNASNLSANNQKNHLITILKEYKISLPLSSGSLQNLSEEQKNKILMPLKYLTKAFDTSRLENVLGQKDILAIETVRGSYDVEGILCKAIGLSSCYDTQYEYSNEKDFRFFTKRRPESIAISGYSMFYNVHCNVGKNSVKIDNMSFDLTTHMPDIYMHATLHQNNNIQPEAMKGSLPLNSGKDSNVYTIETENEKIILYEIGGKKITNDDKSISYEIEYCDGIALVK